MRVGKVASVGCFVTNKNIHYIREFAWVTHANSGYIIGVLHLEAELLNITKAIYRLFRIEDATYKVTVAFSH